MRHVLTAALLAAGVLASTAALAREVRVEVTNLTHGSYFTPLLVAAHPAGVDLFEVGQPASAALQAMAEGGDISGLAAQVEAGGGTLVANPASGVLAPGASTEARLDRVTSVDDLSGEVEHTALCAASAANVKRGRDGPGPRRSVPSTAGVPSRPPSSIFRKLLRAFDELEELFTVPLVVVGR